MTWHWRYEDASGDPATVSGLGPYDYPAQGEAETWIGEHWRDLFEGGVEQVVLLEDGREVYGPMSLRPPD